MKNKEYLKKYLLITIIVASIFAISFMLLANKEYLSYKSSYNKRINDILSLVLDKYPDISEEEVIELLKDDNKPKENLLAKYGYDLQEDDLVKAEDKAHIKYIISQSIMLIILAIILFYIFVGYNLKIDKEIDKIIALVEKINHHEYEMNLDEFSEDRLSILTSEIYKTMIMLKEQADNSLKDKVNIKNSLQDISHQLKTPLTSILIMLDNIIDNPEMDPSQREKFILQIKKDIASVNFLVQSILKLSKFEANSVVFIKDRTKVMRIINKAINNVISLCDLKNVEIKVNNSNAEIICDFTWQAEAITNILKNAVEYSKDNSVVNIEVSTNKIYTEIKIKDTGMGMDKEDLKNIFKRFYKGKDASEDSVGIGLSLAKTIIEKDGGKVEVTSEKDKGTIFTIKYYQK